MIRGNVIRLELPDFPPSVNNLFPTGKHGKRFRSREYECWINSSEAALWMTKFTNMTGPVSVSITLEDKGNRDIDNFAKAILDFLVRYHVIEDDRRKIVRSLNMRWGDVKGCFIEIEGVRG